MDDVWSAGCPLEVVDSPDEGNDRVGVVGHTEVRPPRVVELLHLTTIIALYGKRSHDSLSLRSLSSSFSLSLMKTYNSPLHSQHYSHMIHHVMSHDLTLLTRKVRMV